MKEVEAVQSYKKKMIMKFLLLLPPDCCPVQRQGRCHPHPITVKSPQPMHPYLFLQLMVWSMRGRRWPVT